MAWLSSTPPIVITAFFGACDTTMLPDARLRRGRGGSAEEGGDGGGGGREGSMERGSGGMAPCQPLRVLSLGSVTLGQCHPFGLGIGDAAHDIAGQRVVASAGIDGVAPAMPCSRSSSAFQVPRSQVSTNPAPYWPPGTRPWKPA